MASATVRISENSRNILRELATQEGKSMQVVIEKAIEHYQRQRFLEEVNTAYAALRGDHEAWKKVAEERAQWDATLSDGLSADEEWTEDGAVNRKAGQGESR